MITDKYREELRELTRQIRSTKMDVVFFDYGWNECAEIIMRYVDKRRAESAEQAMKEAADRAADWYKESCLNEYCPSCTAPNCSTIDSLRTAVLSTVKESFTVAHVSTDTEKLAVARRALKVIQSVEHDSSSITYRECMNALRETE